MIHFVMPQVCDLTKAKPANFPMTQFIWRCSVPYIALLSKQVSEKLLCEIMFVALSPCKNIDVYASNLEVRFHLEMRCLLSRRER